MAYFISNQHTKKELKPNIYVLDGIYNIKGKLALYIMVPCYTNMHITFNKGQPLGHIGQPTSVNSVITQKRMDDQIKPDTFTPPLHNLSSKVKRSLDEFLESFKSQFMKD